MSISATDFITFSLPVYIHKHLQESLSHSCIQLVTTLIDLNNNLYPEIANKIPRKLYLETIKKNLLQMKHKVSANKNEKKTIMKKQQIEKLLYINFLELYCLIEMERFIKCEDKQNKIKEEIILTQSSIQDENQWNSFAEYEFMMLLNDYRLICQFEEVGAFKENIEALLNQIFKLKPSEQFRRKIRQIFIKTDINIKIVLAKKKPKYIQKPIQEQHINNNYIDLQQIPRKQEFINMFSSVQFKEDNFKTPQKLRQTNDTQSGCKPTEVASKESECDPNSGLKPKHPITGPITFPLAFSKVGTYKGRTIYSSHPMKFVKKPNEKDKKKKKYIFTDSIDV